MAQKETQDVQNIIARLEKEIYLNLEKPSIKIKKQYAKVMRTFFDLHHELDILNDMKGD